MSSDKFSLAKAPRLPDQVAAVLMKQMDEGELRPGDMLPTEAVMAEQFGVSRAVIREALSQLKWEGLISSHQGKGVLILGPEDRRLLRVPSLESFDAENLAKFFELRAILESGAAGLAALRRSGEELSKLRGNLEAMAQAVAEGANGSLPDFEFHMGVALAGGNRQLSDLMQFLNQKILRTIEKTRHNSSLTMGLSEAAHKEHQAIFNAIEAGDAAQAKQATYDHFCNAANRLGLAVFDQNLG